jgi:hypothetical protein
MVLMVKNILAARDLHEAETLRGKNSTTVPVILPGGAPSARAS